MYRTGTPNRMTVPDRAKRETHSVTISFERYHFKSSFTPLYILTKPRYKYILRWNAYATNAKNGNLATTTVATNGAKETVILDADVVLMPVMNVSVKNVTVTLTTQTNLRCTCRYTDLELWHVLFVEKVDFGRVRMRFNMSKADTVLDVLVNRMLGNKFINLRIVKKSCDNILPMHHVLLMVTMKIMMFLNFPISAVIVTDALSN
jgi:hypothetical protein